MKRRYRRYGQRPGQYTPWVILGVCLVVAVILTLVTGALLRRWLDDETYQKLTQGTAQTPPVSEPVRVSVPNINAYPFALGDDPADARKVPALSISLNTPEGEMLYTSAVAEYLHLPCKESVSLTEQMQAVSQQTAYISGVFYPSAFAYEYEPLRYAATAGDVALVREFLQAGARDVLLLDLPFDTRPLNEILSYVEAVKQGTSSLGAVGVAVPPEIAASETGWEILGQLLTICDFLALDLSHSDVEANGLPVAPADLLRQYDYFLTQYAMRPLLSDRQTALREELELRMYGNYQIFTAPATPMG
ncbi:MAG: hypothetical protein IJX28_08580 [Clostridia bacterium]|nr:hypothetical protein [Clostridia bacterium]